MYYKTWLLCVNILNDPWTWDRSEESNYKKCTTTIYLDLTRFALMTPGQIWTGQNSKVLLNSDLNVVVSLKNTTNMLLQSTFTVENFFIQFTKLWYLHLKTWDWELVAKLKRFLLVWQPSSTVKKESSRTNGNPHKGRN